jgi:hypothetical protein
MLMRWVMRSVLLVVVLLVLAVSIMNEHRVELYVPFSGMRSIALYRLLFGVMASGVMLGLVSAVHHERKKYRVLKKRVAQHEVTIKSLEQEVVALRAEARALHQAHHEPIASQPMRAVSS